MQKRCSLPAKISLLHLVRWQKMPQMIALQQDFNRRHPMTSDVPLFIDNGPNAPRPNLEFVERNSITAIVFNPRTRAYLGLAWKQIDWHTFITGGIEDGQSAEAAARAEVREETGYVNLLLISELPRYDSKFYHGPKGENRNAHFRSFLFELIDD